LGWRWRRFWAGCFWGRGGWDGFGALDDGFDGAQFEHFGRLKRWGDVGERGDFNLGDGGCLCGDGFLSCLGVGGRGGKLLLEEDAIAWGLVAGAEGEGWGDGGEGAGRADGKKEGRDSRNPRGGEVGEGILNGPDHTGVRWECSGGEKTRLPAVLG
jgi:hypothetical protein